MFPRATLWELFWLHLSKAVYIYVYLVARNGQSTVNSTVPSVLVWQRIKALQIGSSCVREGGNTLSSSHGQALTPHTTFTLGMGLAMT